MSDPSTLGNLFALGGATVWAASSLLFARTKVSPGALNLGKNVVAAAAFTATLLALRSTAGVRFLGANLEVTALLAVSALVGLVLGDSFHFRALRLLGARKALVLETLAPVFAAVLAFAIQGERLGPRELAGMAVTLSGVALVVGEKHGRERELDLRTRLAGAAFGALAALGQAGGATLSKRAMVALEATGTPHAALEASMLRLWTAVAIGALIVLVSRSHRSDARQALAPGQRGLIASAALLATYGGVWLSLLAFQHTSVAVASTLLALSPVIVLPLARLTAREHISPRSIVGALLSVAGVALLFLR